MLMYSNKQCFLILFSGAFYLNGKQQDDKSKEQITFLSFQYFDSDQYSKHPHIRTLISSFRLIVFLFKECLVRNQPESVVFFLKLFFSLNNKLLFTLQQTHLNCKTKKIPSEQQMNSIIQIIFSCKRQY